MFLAFPFISLIFFFFFLSFFAEHSDIEKTSLNAFSSGNSSIHHLNRLHTSSQSEHRGNATYSTRPQSVHSFASIPNSVWSDNGDAFSDKSEPREKINIVEGMIAREQRNSAAPPTPFTNTLFESHSETNVALVRELQDWASDVGNRPSNGAVIKHEDNFSDNIMLTDISDVKDSNKEEKVARCTQVDSGQRVSSDGSGKIKTKPQGSISEARSLSFENTKFRFANQQNGEEFVGFGLPATDINFGAQKMKENSPKEPESLEMTLMSLAKSSVLQMPIRWQQVPVRGLSHLKVDFPTEWYQHVISCLHLSGVSHEKLEDLSKDSELQSRFQNIVHYCYAVVNVLGVDAITLSELGPGHVHKCFHGNIPWSPSLDWVEQDQVLKSLILTAYRYVDGITLT